MSLPTEAREKHTNKRLNNIPVVISPKGFKSIQAACDCCALAMETGVKLRAIKLTIELYTTLWKSPFE